MTIAFPRVDQRLSELESAHGDIRALVRLAEEALPDKLFEHHLAGGHIYLPQPTCLRERQSQPGHFAVFAPNTRDEGIKRAAYRPRREDPFD